jgi:hypothetical protein
MESRFRIRLEDETQKNEARAQKRHALMAGKNVSSRKGKKKCRGNEMRS